MADSPAGYWRMDESSGFPQDSSGNANHVTESFGASITYSQPGAIFSDPLSTSIRSTDIHDWRVPDHATLDFGSTFTIEMWLRRARSGIQEWLINKGIGGYAIVIQATDEIVLTAFATSTDAQTATGFFTDTSSWHHLVATKNGAADPGAIYFDGTAASTSGTAHSFVNNAVKLALGSDGPDGAGTNRFQGYLDEIAVYPTALSAARVLAHYNAGMGQVLRPDADVAVGSWLAA